LGEGQNYENQNIEMQKEYPKSIKASEWQKFHYSDQNVANQKDQNVKNQKDQNYDKSTFIILPMDTKACGG
jgi:hypothetical protein